MALSASFRVIKATKALLEVLQRSSSVRGHMIFTLARGPYLQNSLQSNSSFIWKDQNEMGEMSLTVKSESKGDSSFTLGLRHLIERFVETFHLESSYSAVG